MAFPRESVSQPLAVIKCVLLRCQPPCQRVTVMIIRIICAAPAAKSGRPMRATVASSAGRRYAHYWYRRFSRLACGVALRRIWGQSPLRERAALNNPQQFKVGWGRTPNQIQTLRPIIVSVHHRVLSWFDSVHHEASLLINACGWQSLHYERSRRVHLTSAKRK